MVQRSDEFALEGGAREDAAQGKWLRTGSRLKQEERWGGGGGGTGAACRQVSEPCLSHPHEDSGACLQAAFLRPGEMTLLGA